jgi:sulfite reductase beta subunit-like hemoprotein
MRARMKYLVQKMGLDKFRAAIEAEVERVAAERGAELREEVREAVAAYRDAPPPAPRAAAGKASAETEHWMRTNTHPQKQPGYRAVVVQLPIGDMTSDQMRALARLSREYGNGTLRATNDQNVVLQWVPEGAVPALHAALLQIELGNPDVSSINDVVSCPGMDYCSLAITRSMGMAERIRAHLLNHPDSRDGFAEKLGPFAIKISGCPNSCGQHHVGDIGLTGHLAKTPEGTERPYYSILVGGGVGEGKGRIGKRIGRYPEEHAPAAIAALARFFDRERKPGEAFPAFVDRIGGERLVQVAKEAASAAASA